MDKTFVIGDVHGCYHTLKELLNKLPLDSRIIFVGDLCDRGLYTKEVIELIIENNYEAVLGNHDDYMAKHAKECLEDLSCRWYKEDYMGGRETMDSYASEPQTLLKHANWIKTLPRYILIDNFFITHGFALPYFKNRDLKKSYTGLIKNRITDEEEWSHEWEEDWQEYDIINIFGHTHYDEVEIGRNYYGIDTGCVYGGKLTAIELPSMNIISVKANQKDIKS
jgi:serine/threonine protein phosphatase 1